MPGSAPCRQPAGFVSLMWVAWFSRLASEVLQRMHAFLLLVSELLLVVSPQPLLAQLRGGWQCMASDGFDPPGRFFEPAGSSDVAPSGVCPLPLTSSPPASAAAGSSASAPAPTRNLGI